MRCVLGAWKPLRDRFFSHVRKTHSCWIWEGNLNDLGYGRVKVCGRLRAAHRVAYELEVGPIPPGFAVWRLCDDPACVRPDHHELRRDTRRTFALAMVR